MLLSPKEFSETETLLDFYSSQEAIKWLVEV
jgi:hypothetical protein